MMKVMMSGKVVDLPDVDEALVWLVVLIDEKLLPALRKFRSTDCITMILQQGKGMTKEHFLDSNTKRTKGKVHKKKVKKVFVLCMYV